MQPRKLPRIVDLNAVRRRAGCSWLRFHNRPLPRKNLTSLKDTIPRYGYISQQLTALHNSRQPSGRITKECIDLDCQPSSASVSSISSSAKDTSAGILSLLPKSWVPYGELIRIDKPAGTYYLFFPCLFSTLMAAPLAEPISSVSSVAGMSILFFSGALIMRGAGCTINDLWDRNLDPHVARTKSRPIARGAITPFEGLVFTGVQLLAGLGILLQFPLSCFFYAVPSLVLVVCYPLAKRVTYYPQVILGMSFSWGAVLGFPALGVDLLSNSSALTAASFLYLSNVAWTVLYDMIYAHMDIKDDVKAGIKSIALRHDGHTKGVLTGLALTQVTLLGAAGVASGAGPLFFAGSCGGALLTLGVMIKKIQLKSVKDCWWWFVNGCWITGGILSFGLIADYLYRASSQDALRLGFGEKNIPVKLERSQHVE